MTTEEKAKTYAEKRLANDLSGKALDSDKSELLFNAYDIEQAYEDGATEALASQWISAEDQVPKLDEEVLAYTINAFDEYAVAYFDGEDWFDTHGEHIRPHYWLPIPQLNHEIAKEAKK